MAQAQTELEIAQAQLKLAEEKYALFQNGRILPSWNWPRLALKMLKIRRMPSAPAWITWK